MNESTPLVPRARVGADDVENPARGPETDELRSVERDARETRNRVRHPVLIAIAWTMLFVVMATYFHSDGFEKVRASSRTVKGRACTTTTCSACARRRRVKKPSRRRDDIMGVDT